MFKIHGGQGCRRWDGCGRFHGLRAMGRGTGGGAGKGGGARWWFLVCRCGFRPGRVGRPAPPMHRLEPFPRRSDSGLPCFRQRLQHDPLQRIGHPGVEQMRGSGSGSLMCLITTAKGRIGVEGYAAGRPSRRAPRPASRCRCGIQRQRAALFRTHVGGRARQHAAGADVAAADDLGDAEIGQQRLAPAVNMMLCGLTSRWIMPWRWA